jgi:hypothetical protein
MDTDFDARFGETILEYPNLFAYDVSVTEGAE